MKKIVLIFMLTIAMCTAMIGTNTVEKVDAAPDFWRPSASQTVTTYPNHFGADIVNAGFRSPVYASESGTISFSYGGYPSITRRSDGGTYGNRVDIDHGGGYTTRYAHLYSTTVTVGQKVTKGQIIGYQGCTGNCSGSAVPGYPGCFGTHVHFEIRYNNIPNPNWAFTVARTKPLASSAIVQAPQKNYASMDYFGFENGEIHANGWAFNTDLQPNYPQDPVAISYVAFLMDAATGGELARTKAGFYYRNDVAAAFPHVRNVGYGGFRVSFPMQSEWEGKNVFVMIRFANDVAGNYAKVEDNYQLRGKTLELPRSKATLDAFEANDQEIKARGWHVTPKNGKYRYLFVMDSSTGKELTRTQIKNVSRPDVAHLYPSYPQATNSGFAVSIPLQNIWRGKEVYIITRYTDDPAGNNSISDSVMSSQKIVLPGHKTNGYLDEFKRVGNTLKVKGWQVTTKYEATQTRYLFVMDAATGTELYRQKIIGTDRKDVANIFPWIPNAAKSGFETTIPVQASWKGKQIYIMARYATSPGGNDGGERDSHFASSKLLIV